MLILCQSTQFVEMVLCRYLHVRQKGMDSAWLFDCYAEHMENLETMNTDSGTIAESDDVEVQRLAFSSLTSGLVSSIKYFGLEGDNVYYQYCPMAFNNKGDYWLSNSDEVLNPYFGDKMLRCGEVVEVIEF